MFSGKTEDLIREANVAKHNNIPVYAFKSPLDTFTVGKIQSHRSQDRKLSDVTMIQHGSELESICTEVRDSVILIDEVQFFHDDIILSIENVVNWGNRVVVSGPDQLDNGRPFGPMPSLMALGDIVIKNKAICDIPGCQNPATKSMRIAGGGQREIQPGGKEFYEARCRGHYYITGNYDSMPDLSWLTVIAGCIKSGKTEELIRRLKYKELSGEVVKAFKMEAASTEFLETLDGYKYRATPIQSLEEVNDNISKIDVIGIDNIHVLGDDIIKMCESLAKQGKEVILAGLDQKYDGEPFQTTAQAMAISDDLIKLTTLCNKKGCQEVATKSSKIKEDDYSPLCRLHWKN